jgi:RNA polymerase sigma-70 factor (ECF subfamily)
MTSPTTARLANDAASDGRSSVRSPLHDLPSLLARVALGDRAAFRTLYDATQRNLFPVARRITRNESWADEVLQEAYMTVWHRAATFDAAKASPMTWMTTIVRNRALDRLSLASVRHEASVPDEDLEALWSQQSETGDAGAWADDANLRARLRECMSRLKAQHRQSVALAYLNGLSHTEVAEHLGLPLGSVKGWIRRAMEQLKSCLGEPA